MLVVQYNNSNMCTNGWTAGNELPVTNIQCIEELCYAVQFSGVMHRDFLFHYFSHTRLGDCSIRVC